MNFRLLGESALRLFEATVAILVAVLLYPSRKQPPVQEGDAEAMSGAGKVEKGLEERVGSGYQVLLEHLVRCYEAEEENVRRLAETTKMLVNATVAILAVGLFRFGLSASGTTVEVEWVRVLVSLLWTVGLGCLLWSSTYLIFRWDYEWRRKTIDKLRGQYAVGSASLLLVPEEEDLQGMPIPEQGTAEFLRYRATAATLSAVLHLARKNNAREAEISLSRIWFSRGLFVISLAVVLYAGGWWYASDSESADLLNGSYSKQMLGLDEIDNGGETLDSSGDEVTDHGSNQGSNDTPEGREEAGQGS